MSNNKNPLVEAVVSVLNTHLNEGSSTGHIQLTHDEGETIHHIHDVPHPKNSSEESSTMDKIHKAIGKHLHKMHPKHYSSAEDATAQYIDAHQNEADHQQVVPSHQHNSHDPLMPHVHHKTMEHYAKKEAKNSHRFIQDMKGDD